MTDPRRATVVVAERRGTATVLSRLDPGAFLAPRPVFGRRAGVAEVALVGSQMALLGGDHVRIEVRVGPGAHVRIVEPAGLVAHDAGGERSSFGVVASVGAGGTLEWAGQPFVVADGADVDRSLVLALGTGARALVHENVRLGRTGESGGALRLRSEITDVDGPVLRDDLDLSPLARARPGMLGGLRSVATVTAVGWRPGVGAPASVTSHRLDLEAPGAVHRTLAASSHEAAAPAAATHAAWARELPQAG